MLDDLHNLMFKQALKEQNEHIIPANNVEELSDALDKKCLVIAPFCGEPECEEAVRNESAR